jgi:RNA polymerase sigma-70 factor (ECF subfamily)
MDVREESRILSEVLAGDVQAYGLIVRRYQEPIYNLMLRMTSSAEDARDLSQETFIRAYNNLDQFRPGARFFPWLYSLGMNLALDFLRKRKRTTDRTLEFDESRFEQSDDGDDPAQLSGIEAEELKRAMDKLPADNREALILRFHEDLSMQEVAQALDISVSGAKMRVHRGLRMLRGFLS